MSTNPKNKVASQPRKVRKAYYDAPLHQRKHSIRAHLDDELLVKYNARNIAVRRGDTVKVMRGGYRGHVGKISNVDTKNRRLYIEKVTSVKADGKEKPRPIHPSNVLVTKLELSDPWRKEKLEKRSK